MKYRDLLTRSRLVQHLLFWVLSFYVLLRLFAYEFPPQQVDYVYTFLFHLSLWLGVYLNLMLLIPNFLKKGKYLLYTLCFLLNILLVIGMNEVTFSILSDWIFPDYYFISYYNFYDLLQFALAYLGVSSLLKLSKAWFELNKKDKRIKELEAQKLQIELNGLKHQISPHLLFNNLNAIYGMILDDNPNAGDALLNLSNNMRYVLYQTNVESISLEKEIAFIKDYINLQRLRIPEATCEITFESIEQPDNFQVVPLLFLPFVENAFKHGVNITRDDNFVHIHLRQAAANLVFKVRNSKKNRTETQAPQKEGGIGLSNVKNRLEKCYPNQYTLDIHETERIFEIILTFPKAIPQ